MILFDTLLNFRAEKEKMYKLAAILGIVAIFMLTMTVLTLGFPKVAEGPAPTVSLTTIVANCLNSGAISWIDPWTERAKLTICDTVDAPLYLTEEKP